MIDPDIMSDNEFKPVRDNFIWFAFFLISSASMLGLTVNGLVALISSDSCDKKEAAITQTITNKGAKP